MGVKTQRLTFNQWVEITGTGVPSTKDQSKLLTYQEFQKHIKELTYASYPMKNRR